jgi:hypothetical protein
MESSLLQDVLRETVVRTLAGQLQPRVGHSHRCLPVLHLLQLPQACEYETVDLLPI